MFVRSVKCVKTEFKELAIGDNIVIDIAPNETEIIGKIKFISRVQQATNIIVDVSNIEKSYGMLKIYYNRMLAEFTLFGEDYIQRPSKVEGLYIKKSIASNGVALVNYNSYNKELQRFEELYCIETSGYKNVPVKAGDKFFKNGKEFKVIAISGNGNTMFMEDEKGEGLPVGVNDTSLAKAFGNEFSNGTPDL